MMSDLEPSRVNAAVALQEEMALAVASRRMSVAPVNRASNVRNLSGRHGSMFFGRSTPFEGTLYKADVCDLLFLLSISSVTVKRFLKGKKAASFYQLNFRLELIQELFLSRLIMCKLNLRWILEWILSRSTIGSKSNSRIIKSVNISHRDLEQMEPKQ